MRDTENLKVLIAEDNGTNQLLITRMLKSLLDNPHITLVKSGEDAYETFTKKGYDLIILDGYLLDGLKGWDVCKKMRELEDREGLDDHHLIFSWSTEENYQEKAFEGADAYLSKPIKKTQLSALLEQYILKAYGEDKKSSIVRELLAKIVSQQSSLHQFSVFKQEKNFQIGVNSDASLKVRINI